MVYRWYTGSLLPWKSGWKKPVGLHGSRFTSNSWGKSETGATGPANAEKLTVNLLHGSSSSDMSVNIFIMEVWKLRLKNPYVEVTWGSRHQVGNFYVNMFSPDVEYILLGRSLKPTDWPPHHFFSSLHLSSHPCHVRAIEDATFRNQWCPNWCSLTWHFPHPTSSSKFSM